MRGFGTPYRRRDSRFWWIRYWVGGKPVSESSKSTKKSDAVALLKKRQAEALWLTEAPKRMTVSNALDDYLDDIELRRLRSVRIQKRACTIIREHMGSMLAKEVSTGTLKRLQKRLSDSGYAAATVNRLVTTVYSTLKLAASNGYLVGVPQLPKQLKRAKPRQGFLEHDDYLAIAAELPDWAGDVFEMFYRTGWRRNEVLWLSWAEVDLKNQVIRLDPERDKGGETRVWPLKNSLREVIERRARARIVGLPYVFHRNGKKIGLTAWRNVFVKACGDAGRHFYTHDCRRTAARTLERAGVPRNVAMKLIGHKTETMYKRYRIVNDEDLDDAAKRLESYYEHQEQEPTNRVVRFSRKKG